MNNKRIGNRAERKVAALLSLVFKKPFIRTPTSGAYVGGSNRQRIITLDNNQVRLMRGDIIPPENYNVVIEVKKRNVFSFGKLFTAQLPKELCNWLVQVRNDASIDNSNYLLFILISRIDTFLVIEYDETFLLDNVMLFEYNNICYCFVSAKQFLLLNRERLIAKWE